jgi:1,4-alpha-glucan branching enzyme
MTSAAIVILLHTHMPYVRRNGDWPVGEEWLLEAWAESYIPIWRTIEELSSGALPGKLALTMTPVLAEQLQDEYMEERLDWYLKNKISHTLLEMERLEGMGDEPRRHLASLFRDLYQSLLRDFEERFRGRMIKVLADGMDAGVIEVMASAATHAHLPSLGSARSRKAQVEIGLDSYRRCFKREPRGFWLPECSYAPELDELLEGFSPPLSYVVLDFSAGGGTAVDARTWEPHRLGRTSLLALLRDRSAHELVWTMQGYPSGGEYREFAKRDYDGWGFQYWRITSQDTPLDEKDIYHPARAESQAEADARDFASILKRQGEGISSAGAMTGTRPVMLAAYDTELIGHWWKEGPLWLREVLRLLGDDSELPYRVAERAPLADAPGISPPTTAWNVDGTFSTWVNPGTADIWEDTHRAERELARLAMDSPHASLDEERALAQAAREVLLMESSDWTFMITRGEAAAYARDRFTSHHDRLSAVMGMLDGGGIDPTALASLEETDNIFPWLTPHYWR